jgi:hypothetical protein
MEAFGDGGFSKRKLIKGITDERFPVTNLTLFIIYFAAFSAPSAVDTEIFYLQRKNQSK